MFHASLLHAHVQNDDRLFPGQLHNQITDNPDTTEPEWAVNKIVNHHGSKTDTIFEVEWMLGDITWLPYHQVSHLQALDTYLEALGASTIRKLPVGTGQPPNNDPQVFAGFLSVQTDSSPTRVLINPRPTPLRNYFLFTIFPLPAVPRRYANNMSQSFIHITRTGQTQFTQTDPVAGYVTSYPLKQIAEFIKFDRALRKGNKSSSDASPAGYFDFAHIYNTKLNVHTKFSVFDNNGAVLISGPQKGLQTVIPGGSPTDATARVMATPIPKHKKPYARDTTLPRSRPPLAPSPLVTSSLPSLSGFMPPTFTPDQMLIVSEVMINQLGQNLRAKHGKEAAIQARHAEKAQKQATRHSAYAKFICTTPTTPAPTHTTTSPPVTSSSTLLPLSHEEELALYAAVAAAPATMMLIDINSASPQASEPST